jgi:hypothetical protein
MADRLVIDIPPVVATAVPFIPLKPGSERFEMVINPMAMPC